MAADCTSSYGEGVKRIRHPIAGPIVCEYSAVAIEGRLDLGMVVYNACPRSAPHRQVTGRHLITLNDSRIVIDL
jgi:hypothetical protein